MEFVGLLGTVFVLLSFLQHNEMKIRIINIIGAVLFVIYGLSINALSTWLLNLILVFIHVYNLVKRG